MKPGQRKCSSSAIFWTIVGLPCRRVRCAAAFCAFDCTGYWARLSQHARRHAAAVVCVDGPDDSRQRKKPGAGDRPRGAHSACAGRRGRGPEPRPDRAARRILRARRCSASLPRSRARSSLIAASPNGRVRLGPTILRLAASVRTDFVGGARPFISRLSSELRETVDLASVRNDHLVFIDQVIGSHRLRTVSAVGETLSAVLHRQRQGLSQPARRRRDRAPDRRGLRGAHAEDADAARCAARGPQAGAQDRRRLRSRGAHARHLRRRRRAARSARQCRWRSRCRCRPSASNSSGR